MLTQVIYGDTLRRFTVSVGVNGLLDVNMVHLTGQIRALFNFPPDADLTLTYTDEDKDDVMLVDDNDLYDATRQKLNPLRIKVVKNMVKPARFDSMSSSAFVVPRPAMTISGEGDGLKCDLQVPNSEICAGSESSLDPPKADMTNVIMDRLLENNEKNIDHVNNKSTEEESSFQVGSFSDAHRQTPIESEKPTLDIPIETQNVATKIRIMEAMSKVGESSDMVKFKSKANENSKLTNAFPHDSSRCPDQALMTSPDHTTQEVEAPYISTNELTHTQLIYKNTHPEMEVEVAYEAGTSKPAIDKGKSKIQLLDDFNDPVTESSPKQSEPSNASFSEVDCDYEQMLLNALEQMGFKQIDLNTQILRKNLFDLSQTITDLCDMGEWHEVLVELESLGFCDKGTNVELLKKNEGNIKDVIMTLISEEIE